MARLGRGVPGSNPGRETKQRCDMKKTLIAISLLMTGCAPVVYVDPAEYASTSTVPAGATVVTRTEYRAVEVPQAQYTTPIVVRPAPVYYQPVYYRPAYYANPAPYYGLSSLIFGAALGYAIAH